MRKVLTMVLFGLITLMVLPTAAHGATIDVTVGPGGALVFMPSDIVIDEGDTVLWTWDSSGHNVGSGLPGAPTPPFLSGPPALAGTTFSVTFDQAFLTANPVAGNVYDYHCHPHGLAFSMVGSITVVPAPVPCPADIADFNGGTPDGTVNVFDLLELLANWGTNGTGADIAAPTNTVDVFDLLDLLAAWGDCE